MTYIHFMAYYSYFCSKYCIYHGRKGEKERTVIHVQINEEHHYFGSIANIYEFFTSEQVGITYGALRNYGLNFDKPYQNSKCIIRKGILLAKKGNRGKKG